MNRQLKEFAEEAGYPDYMTYGQDLVLERFAELIVRECSRLIETKDARSEPADHIYLLKHFGIEP
jgi:hypothetical protein